MGIRIHKAMGYAWDKVTPACNIMDWINDHDTVKVRDFLPWCNEHKDFLKAIYRTDAPNHEDQFKFSLIDLNPKLYKDDVLNKSIIEYIKFDPEYGLENVLLLIPPGSDEWFRYDNVIDYYECSVYHEEQAGESRIIKLFTNKLPEILMPRKGGIFPYLYRWPPITIAGLCVYMNLPNVFNKLEEAIYTWWS